MLKKMFITLCLSASLLGISSVVTKQESGVIERNGETYNKPSFIALEEWEQLKPYFLPTDHSIKGTLDHILSQIRAVESHDKMIEAGFVIPEPKEHDLIVASHPMMPGYLFKLYYDNYDVQRFKTKGDGPLWFLRIQGAERARNSIKKHGYEKLMTVPKKWVYPLPVEPAPALPSDKCFRKHYIVVVEQMDIVDNRENERSYKEKMTPELLSAFYTLLKETGLYDCVYIDNNPFLRDGRIAFVDTEEFDFKPIDWQKVAKHLNPAMKAFWIDLSAEKEGCN